MRTKLLLLSVWTFFSFSIYAQTEVVPPAYTSSAGGSSFLGPFHTGARTYQLLINENQLNGLLGKELTGLTWRTPAGGSGFWPASDATNATYEIWIGTSVAPANRSLTAFSDNYASPLTMVRGGSLTIGTNSFSTGATPNAFGPFIDFSRRYTYSGGHLLVEIRHSGSVTGTTRSVDAINTTTSGYGTNFSACWQGTGGILQGNFSVLAFRTEDIPTPLSLVSFTGVLDKAVATLQWSTANELNTDKFEIEKSINGLHYSTIGTVKATGNSVSTRKYEYADRNALSEQAPVLYYRLKMIDKDGQYSYSQVIPLRVNAKSTFASLHPNPVKHAATLSVNAEKAGTVTYTIIDNSGRKIKTGVYELRAGTNAFTIHADYLRSGNYTLLLLGNNIREQLQFIKQ